MSRASRLLLLALALLPCAAATVVDHRTELVEEIDGERRAEARTLTVVLGMGRQGHLLPEALKALADADQEHALRYKVKPGTAWLAKGGIGAIMRGKSLEPVDMLAGLGEEIARLRPAARLRVACLLLGADAITDGDQPEYRKRVTQQTRVAIGLEAATTSLSAMRERRIESTGPNGATVSLPLQEPEIAYSGVSLANGSPNGELSIEVERFPSQRQPQLAAEAYLAAMDAVAEAQPEARLVFATVPLRPTGNQQRVDFNRRIRAAAAERGAVLFDIADILAHDKQGLLASSEGVPQLAACWRRKLTVNEAGRERLARLWWQLLDELAVAP